MTGSYVSGPVTRRAGRVSRAIGKLFRPLNKYGWRRGESHTAHDAVPVPRPSQQTLGREVVFPQLLVCCGEHVEPFWRDVVHDFMAGYVVDVGLAAARQVRDVGAV